MAQNTTPRRSLLAGTAALAAPGDAGPDADLIAACGAFHAADAAIQADPDDADPDLRPFYSALSRLTDLTARTPAGRIAKARAAYAAMLSAGDGGGWPSEELAAMAALADVLGEG